MSWWGKLFLIYVRGDSFVLLPVLGIIAFTALFSIKLALLSFGILIAVRQFGELIYWMLQQFGDKKYMQYEFGIKNLDNNGIYTLYQTFPNVRVVLGVFITISSLSI